MVNIATAKKNDPKIFVSLVLISILVFVLVVFLAKFINHLVSKKLETPKPVETPAYLGVALPDINPIEQIIQNSKIDELRYQPTTFGPVEPTIKGRTNPFLPL